MMYPPLWHFFVVEGLTGFSSFQLRLEPLDICIFLKIFICLYTPVLLRFVNITFIVVSVELSTQVLSLFKVSCRSVFEQAYTGFYRG
jgi:hypothetical protein